MSKAISSNIWKLYIGSFITNLFFFIPIIVPFFSDLGFTMQQILVLEASFALTLVILEVPSGYFADIYGRKISLIVAAILLAIGVAVFSLSYSFLGFLIAEILVGMAVSFESGAHEALIYDSLIEMKQEKNYKKIQGNMFFNARIAGVIANITGGVLAVVFLRLPFYVSIIPPLLWLPITFFLIEPKRHKMEYEHWDHFKRILKETLQTKKLKWFIIHSAMPSAFFLMGFWMYQRYMVHVELPLYYFGIVIAGMNICSGIGSKFAKELEKVISLKGSLLMISFIPVVFWIAMSSIGSVWGVLFIVFVGFIWGFSAPVFQDFVQKLVSSDRRATVLSMMSLLKRSMFFIMAPFIGWIIDLYNVQTALYISAMVLLSLSLATLFMLKKVKVL